MKSVYLNDSKISYEGVEEHFECVADWARAQCPSFIGYRVQDVSDVSPYYDHVAEYKFQDAKDAVWFELKWR